MALKAGYKGIKKSVLEQLMSLFGSVAIKEIGDGLALSDEGELEVSIGDGLTTSADGEIEVDIDTNTMQFVDGKISAKATAVDYSTTEFNTGRKWVDGKDIYGKVTVPTDVPISSSWVNLGASGIGVDVADMIITVKAVMSDAAGNEFFPVPDGTLDISFNKHTDVMYVKSLSGSWDHGPKWVYIEYTKVTPEP